MGQIKHTKFEEFVGQLQELRGKITDIQSQTREKSLKKWLNSKEAAQTLNVSVATLQNYREKGLISYSQIGSKIFYRYKDVHSLIIPSKL